MTNNQWRDLNKAEKFILEKMFETPFPGRDELREQIVSCKVRDVFDALNKFWGIEFLVKSSALAKVKMRVPIEAYSTKNGPQEILLHVIDGKIKELELVQYGDDSPESFPDAKDIKVRVSYM